MNQRGRLLAPSVKKLGLRNDMSLQETIKSRTDAHVRKIRAGTDSMADTVRGATELTNGCKALFKVANGILRVEGAIQGNAERGPLSAREQATRAPSELKICGLKALEASASAQLACNQLAPSKHQAQSKLLNATRPEVKGTNLITEKMGIRFPSPTNLVDA